MTETRLENGNIQIEATPSEYAKVKKALEKNTPVYLTTANKVTNGLWKCECGGLRTAQFNYCPECGRPLVTVC